MRSRMALKKFSEGGGLSAQAGLFRRKAHQVATPIYGMLPHRSNELPCWVWSRGV